MKICVFSDSHGNCAHMLEAIEKSRPGMVIHLGDGRYDADKIRSRFPDIPLKAVRGNCDPGSALPEKELLYIHGVKIFMTHGHLYHVKSGLGALLSAGHSSQANLILYGHTHIALHERFGAIEALNPGSCGSAGYKSFAILEISGGGEISVNIIKL